MGRPLDVVRHRFERILRESGAHLRFHKILKQTQNDLVFLKAYEIAHDRAYGKAPQYVEMDVNGRFIPVSSEQVYAALGEKIPLELLEDHSGEEGSSDKSSKVVGEE